MRGKGLDTDINEINGSIPDNERKGSKIWFKILVGFGVMLLLLAAIAYAYISYVLSVVNYEDKTSVVRAQEHFEVEEEPLNIPVEKEEVHWETEKEQTEIVEPVKVLPKVHNFILCGVEAMGGGRGRTDAIMLATINEEQESIKMTSIMRDTYVTIEGYSNNKLNASYSQGGMPLLMDTIEKNFNIKIDGYALVNFDGFKEIIDALGGVQIELSKKEANYLNKTNYIADERYRNVVEGKQILNGEQALGYSRVRYVPTPNGLHNDFGRNYRQRNVLQSIFNQYKSKSITEILMLLPDILKLVTTDMSKSDLIKYMTIVLKMGVGEIETNKVPMDGTFKNASVNGMSVLYITDIDKVREELHKFVYGDDILVENLD